MRRLGAVAVTLALIALGLGAGLWLGSPANASPGDIQVDMDDSAGFVTSTPTKLLDMSALAPGGSVTGHMWVRDASGHDGTSLVDTIILMAHGVTYGDTCPLAASVCRDASEALASALSFTITATGPGGVGTTTADLTTLAADGVAIGSGMVDRDTLDVTVTASLDFHGVGNEVQYGSVTFDIALGIDSTDADTDDGTPTGGSTTNDGGGAGTAGDVTGAQPGSDVEVAGENEALSPDNGIRNNAGAGGTDILILGENKSELPNTGVPVILLLTLGGGVLLIGLGLLYAARRRSA